MKRRVSGVEFAVVWGKVSRWGQQDRDDLMGMMRGLPAKEIEPKKHEPRKPRSGPAEVGA